VKILGFVPALPKPHYFSKFRIPSIGLLTLLTKAKQAGHQTALIMEEISGLPEEKMARKIREADLIAVSSLSATHPRAKQFVSSARRISRIPVVMGGPHVTFCPEDGLSVADFVIRYEGEFAFPALLEALQGLKDIRQVPNLSWKNGREVVHNPVSEILPDLDDDSPFPDYGIVLNKKFLPFVSLETSRGCPYRCSFCCVPRMFKAPRQRNPEAVVEYIERTNPPGIFFCDDHFAGDREKSKRILELMLRRLDQIPPWAAQVRVSVGKDKEWLRLARRTGCRFLCMGFESVNPQSLKEAHKGQTLEETEYCLAQIKEAGLLKSVHGSFAVGFDADDETTAVRTAKWARKMGIPSIQITVLTPLFGTPLHQKLESEGRILTDYPGNHTGTRAVFNPARMTPEQLQKSVFAGLKEFSSFKTILFFFLKGGMDFFREYLAAMFNGKILIKNLREASIKLYIRNLIRKLEKRSKNFIRDFLSRKRKA